ncbi:hypothetical protein [Vibrio methylphosphonaticus]|uniref:hypothetical protein n=1 Tax=Vibrio methylphosphonaticus TaxID=2946866 RepID=UPI00202A4CC2|nr:hypothetical protein [Vibrio methylphosphonaticus]MCL9777277.1 hypothetical protein [Vibrio methylphosphonaticus]
MENLALLRQQFSTSSQQATHISQALELGQAQTPLSEKFQHLATQSQSQDFHLTLIGLSGAARNAAINWLYGQEYSVFAINHEKAIGLLEITLKKQGYSLEQNGTRQEFDDWTSLEKVLGEGLSFGDTPQNLKLDVPSEKGLQNLTIYIPDSITTLKTYPAALTRVLMNSNVLAIAGEAEAELRDEDARELEQLAAQMQGFWPLIHVPDLTKGIQLPENGWFNHFRCPIRLPEQLLTDVAETSIPDILTNPNDPMRQKLNLLSQSNALLQGVDALNDEFEQQAKKLTNRKKRESRQTERADNGNGYSIMLDSALKQRINDEFNDLNKNLAELSRKRETPNATNVVNLAAFVEQLDVDGLDQHKQHKIIKLGLSDDYQQQLLAVIKQQSDQFLIQDVLTLEQGLANITMLIKNHPQTEQYQLSSHTFSKSRLQQELQEVLGIEIRYQGELPHQGFLARLGAGRQAMMGLMFVGMVLGAFSPNLRSVLMLLGLPLFFAGVIYSYISFPKEEAARMEKELHKVRGEVNNIAKRLVSETNRLKVNQINRFLDQQKRHWLSELESQHKTHVEEKRQQQQFEAKQANQRIAVVEQQLRQLKMQTQPINQLQRQVEALINQLQTS